MKLAIIGSRTFDDWNVLDDTMHRWFNRDSDDPLTVTEVISGGARGADSLAARWATGLGIKSTVFKPDWDKHGKAAGFIRNEDIVAAADMVLAFWGMDPEGKELSRGTANSLSIAKRLKKPTLIIYVGPTHPPSRPARSEITSILGRDARSEKVCLFPRKELEDRLHVCVSIRSHPSLTLDRYNSAVLSCPPVNRLFWNFCVPFC